MQNFDWYTGGKPQWGFENPNFGRNVATLLTMGGLNQFQDDESFAAAMRPQYRQALLRAQQNLSPLREQQALSRYGAAARGRAMQQGRQMAGMLRQQGFGPAAQAGARENALNMAQSATNVFAGQVQSPEARQARMMQLLQMLSPGMASPDRGMFLNLMDRSQLNQQQGQRSPTFWEQAAGVAGAIPWGML